jgi:hypothetical protein
MVPCGGLMGARGRNDDDDDDGGDGAAAPCAGSRPRQSTLWLLVVAVLVLEMRRRKEALRRRTRRMRARKRAGLSMDGCAASHARVLSYAAWTGGATRSTEVVARVVSALGVLIGVGIGA